MAEFASEERPSESPGQRASANGGNLDYYDYLTARGEWVRIDDMYSAFLVDKSLKEGRSELSLIVKGNRMLFDLDNMVVDGIERGEKCKIRRRAKITTPSVVYQYESDDHWIPYDIHVCELLHIVEEAGRKSIVIHCDEITSYLVDFESKTVGGHGHLRQFRAKPTDNSGTQMISEHNRCMRWEVYDETTRLWAEFADSHNTDIMEACLDSNQDEAIIHIGEKEVIVYLDTMTVSGLTHRTQKTRRLTSTNFSASQCRFEWDNLGVWTPFSIHESELLRLAHVSGRQFTTLYIGTSINAYFVNFDEMKQMNTATGNSRRIRKCEGDALQAALAAESEGNRHALLTYEATELYGPTNWVGVFDNETGYRVDLALSRGEREVTVRWNQTVAFVSFIDMTMSGSTSERNFIYKIRRKSLRRQPTVPWCWFDGSQWHYFDVHSAELLCMTKRVRLQATVLYIGNSGTTYDIDLLRNFQQNRNTRSQRPIYMMLDEINDGGNTGNGAAGTDESTQSVSRSPQSPANTMEPVTPKSHHHYMQEEEHRLHEEKANLAESRKKSSRGGFASAEGLSNAPQNSSSVRAGQASLKQYSVVHPRDALSITSLSLSTPPSRDMTPKAICSLRGPDGFGAEQPAPVAQSIERSDSQDGRGGIFFAMQSQADPLPQSHNPVSNSTNNHRHGSRSVSFGTSDANSADPDQRKASPLFRPPDRTVSAYSTTDCSSRESLNNDSRTKEKSSSSQNDRASHNMSISSTAVGGGSHSNPTIRRAESDDGSTLKTVPKSYYCPLSKDIMADPVICDDGYSYERANIEEYMKTKMTSPMTGERLHSTVLIPNKQLQKTIEDFKKR